LISSLSVRILKLSKFEWQFRHIEFEKLIQKKELQQGVEFDYIRNPSNDLFELYYIIQAYDGNPAV